METNNPKTRFRRIALAGALAVPAALLMLASVSPATHRLHAENGEGSESADARPADDPAAESPDVNIESADPVALGGDELPPERWEAIRRLTWTPDEPLILDHRLHVQNVIIRQDVMQVWASVRWSDGEGRPIEGIRVSLELRYKFDMAPLTDVEAQRNWVVLEGMLDEGNSRLETDSNGEVRANFRTLGGKPWMPGEYYVVPRISVADQAPEVMELMRQDATLYGMYENEAGEDVLIETDEERRAAFESFISGTAYVPTVPFKVVITPEYVWVDRGTLAAFNDVMVDRAGAIGMAQGRVNQARVNLDVFDRDHGRDLTPAQRAQRDHLEQLIGHEQGVLQRARELFELGGGAFNEAEMKAVLEARENQKQAMKSLYLTDDVVYFRYLFLVHGDFKFWEWKLTVLYGPNVFNALQEGKLPWERTASGFDPQPRNEAQWKQAMRQRTTLLVRGDRDTWPPRGEQPTGTPVWGGHYPERALPYMLRAIDDFNIAEFLTENPNEEARETRPWVLNDANWRDFERDVLRRSGFEGSAGSEDALRASFFRAQPATDTTGTRVRNLGMRQWYGLPVARYPRSAAAMEQAFEALVYLPVAYRYTFYTVCQGMEPARAIQRIREFGGADIPAFAITPANTLYARHTAALNEARSNLRMYHLGGRTHTFDRHGRYVVWYYGSEGPRRNMEPDEATKRAMAAARRQLEQRYDPAARGTTEASGESDIVIEEQPPSPDAIGREDGQPGEDGR